MHSRMANACRQKADGEAKAAAERASQLQADLDATNARLTSAESTLRELQAQCEEQAAALEETKEMLAAESEVLRTNMECREVAEVRLPFSVLNVLDIM